MCRRAEETRDRKMRHEDLVVLVERGLQAAQEEAYMAADREENGDATKETKDGDAAERTKSPTEP